MHRSLLPVFVGVCLATPAGAAEPLRPLAGSSAGLSVEQSYQRFGGGAALTPVAPHLRTSGNVANCRAFYESFRGTGWSANYLHGAIVACEVTGDGPAARHIRQCLQTEMLGVSGTYVAELRRMDAEGGRGGLRSLFTGQTSREASLLYDMHLMCYQSAGCPAGPAALPTWDIILTVPLRSLPMSLQGPVIKFSIDRFGPCSGIPGRFELPPVMPRAGPSLLAPPPSAWDRVSLLPRPEMPKYSLGSFQIAPPALPRSPVLSTPLPLAPRPFAPVMPNIVPGSVNPPLRPSAGGSPRPTLPPGKRP